MTRYIPWLKNDRFDLDLRLSWRQTCKFESSRSSFGMVLILLLQRSNTVAPWLAAAWIKFKTLSASMFLFLAVADIASLSFGGAGGVPGSLSETLWFWFSWSTSTWSCPFWSWTPFISASHYTVFQCHCVNQLEIDPYFMNKDTSRLKPYITRISQKHYERLQLSNSTTCWITFHNKYGGPSYRISLTTNHVTYLIIPIFHISNIPDDPRMFQCQNVNHSLVFLCKYSV